MSKKLLKNCLVIGAVMMATAFGAPVFATNFVTATQLQVVPAASLPTTITATCPTGYVVIGGGFSELNNVSKNGGGASAYLTPQNQVGYIINPYFTVYASQPTATGNGWQVNGQVSILAPANVTVYAICASLD